MSKPVLRSLLVIFAVGATALACYLLFAKSFRPTVKQQSARQPAALSKEEMLQKRLDGIGRAKDLSPVPLPTTPAHE